MTYYHKQNLRVASSVWALALFAGIAACPSTARAQSATPDQPQLETVTVSAERHAEDLQNTALAITAITAKDLQARGISNSLDLSVNVPNMYGSPTSGSRSGTFTFIRGLGTQNPFSSLDVAVSNYVDDVLRPNLLVSTNNFFDIDHVEVLRGPQGTTFGRNSTGGAVLVVTAKPTDTYDANLSASYGSLDDQIVRGSANVPISDNIFAKVAFFHETTRGWLTNLTTNERLNGKELGGARLALRILPADNITWDLSAEHSNVNGGMTRSYTDHPNITRQAGVSVGATNDIVADAIANRGLRGTGDSTNLASNLTWNGDRISVSFISGYNLDFMQDLYDASGTPLTNFTATPAPAYNIENESDWNVSEELKANGTALDGALTYVTGLYYFKSSEKQLISNATAGAVNCSPGELGDGHVICPGGKLGYSATRQGNINIESYAAYAQLEYKLLDDLTLSGGLRWTQEKKNLVLPPVSAAGQPAGGVLTSDLVRYGVATNMEKSLMTPRVVLRWEPADNQMYYMSMQQGFKSGGWLIGATPGTTSAVKPERSTSYEVGTKLTFFGNRVRFNADAFFQQTNNLQLAFTVDNFLVPNGAPLQTLQNAGDMETHGIEADFEALLTDDLDVFGNFALQNGHYTYINPAAQSFTAANGTVVNGIDPGDKLAYFPPYSGTIGVSYTLPLHNIGGSLVYDGILQVQSGTWRIASNPTTPVPAYSNAFESFNTGFTYNPDGGKWNLQLQCINCTNVQRRVGSTSSSFFYSDPREIMATVGLKL